MTPARFERRLDVLRLMVDRRLATIVQKNGPADLTDACRYLLSGGGKRLRAILVLLSCDAVGGKIRAALDAGCAVEVMHNFTLVHDDIMDHAQTRRGRQTVHLRWDINTALLSGDVLLGLSYRQLLRTRHRSLPSLVALFTAAVLEVCEGQAMDLEFERRTDVSLGEYFTMIEKKTGRLMSLSSELGALLGGGSKVQVQSMRKFGHYLGRAFQIQDDLLDVLADEKRFGKRVGGDILEGKRTFLLLRAAETARGRDREYLRRVMRGGARGLGSPRAVVRRATEIYEHYGVVSEAKSLIARNTRHALATLDALPTGNASAMLRWLSEALVNRAF